MLLNKITCLSMAVLFLLSGDSFAAGIVTPVTSPIRFNPQLDNVEGNNYVGFTTSSEWSESGGLGPREWYIDCKSIDSSGYDDRIRFNASYITTMASVGDGWYSFDDYWDIKTEIFINSRGYVAVPFKDVINTNAAIGNYTCKSAGPLYNSVTITSGAIGKLSMRLKKKIVNGYSFYSKELVNVYGATADNMAISSVPFATIKMQSFEISLPEKCTINSGQVVDVDFGNVSTTKLDGNHYSIIKDLKLACSSGDFESGLSTVLAEFSGGSSKFNSNYFLTDNEGIGISLREKDGGLISPQDIKKIALTNGIGVYPITINPVSDSTTSQGDFNASIIVRLLLE